MFFVFCFKCLTITIYPSGILLHKPILKILIWLVFFLSTLPGRLIIYSWKLYSTPWKATPNTKIKKKKINLMSTTCCERSCLHFNYRIFEPVQLITWQTTAKNGLVISYWLQSVTIKYNFILFLYIITPNQLLLLLTSSSFFMPFPLFTRKET